MKPYIFGERNGIYIIDLNKTAQQFRDAEDFVTQSRGRRPHGALRGHQASGAGRDCRRSAALRHVLHQPALAGRPADQLHHDSAQPRPAPRSRGDGHRRPLRIAVEERDCAQREGEAQAPEEPRRHPPHVAPARRDLRRRHRQGEDCRRRGPQAEDSGHRHRRHQLRPRRSGLRDPGQRRRPARRSGCSRRRSPTPSAAAASQRESRMAEEDGGAAKKPRRPPTPPRV